MKKFNEYTLDYGSDASVKKMKKTTPGQKEAVDPADTGGKEEVSMAVKQIAGIRHFVDDIERRVKSTGDMEEWYQNKLTKAHDYLKTIYAYGKGDDAVTEEKDSRLKNAGVEGFNKPKRTPGHPKKSHIVVAKDGDKVKTIRFGEQGASTAGDPKKGESDKMKKKRASFKARHAKNIAKGKMSAAYWADKEKW